MYRRGAAKTAAFVVLGVTVCVVLGILIKHDRHVEELRARTEVPTIAANPSNRAAYYFHATELLKHHPQHDALGEDQLIPMIDSLAESGFQWDEAPEALREFVNDNRAALEDLRSGAAVAECDFPVVFGSDANGISEIEVFRRFRLLGRLLLCASVAAVHEGREEEGIEHALFALRIGQDMLPVGCTGQAMAGNYVCRMGSRALAAAVTGQLLSEEALELLAKKLPEYDIPWNDRCAVPSGNADWVALYVKENAPKHVDVLSALHLGGFFDFTEFEPGTAGSTWELVWPSDVLQANTAVHETMTPDTIVFTKKDLCLVAVGIGVQRYARQHGDVPDTLDALVPEFLEAVPEDTVGNEPLQCTTARGVFTVYTAKEEFHNGRELTFRADRLVPAAQGPGT
jgi:hypothetical protein